MTMQVEFDPFITEATRMANRMRAAGRLLEFPVVPGGQHGSELGAGTQYFINAMEAYKLALKEYLFN